jgi:hypothetical protein
LGCPFISDDVGSVVARFFKDLADRLTERIEDCTFVEPETVIRCTGRYKSVEEGSHVETDSVIFLSGPYLTLQHGAASHEQNETHPLSLLHYLYGYDPKTKFGTPKMIRELNIGGKNDSIRVSQLWSVVIGAKYVTSSCSHVRFQ